MTQLRQFSDDREVFFAGIDCQISKKAPNKSEIKRNYYKEKLKVKCFVNGERTVELSSLLSKFVINRIVLLYYSFDIVSLLVRGVRAAYGACLECSEELISLIRCVGVVGSGLGAASAHGDAVVGIMLY